MYRRCLGITGGMMQKNKKYTNKKMVKNEDNM